MKLLKHSFAALCLIFALSLTIQANGGEGHMCCPLLAPPPPPPPPASSKVIQPAPKSAPDGQENGEDNILTWAAEIASGAWQVFIALV